MTEEELQELYKQREAAYAALIEEYGLRNDALWERDDPENVKQYAYVQSEWVLNGDGAQRYWISTFNKPEDAAIYQAQEEGEWKPEVLVDLDRGKRYDTVMRFIESLPEQPPLKQNRQLQFYRPLEVVSIGKVKTDDPERAVRMYSEQRNSSWCLQVRGPIRLANGQDGKDFIIANAMLAVDDLTALRDWCETELAHTDTVKARR